MSRVNKKKEAKKVLIKEKYGGHHLFAQEGWCNQPNFLKKTSFREFCKYNQSMVKTDKKNCTAMRVLQLFESNYPDLAEKYFDLKFESFILDDEQLKTEWA